jgi:hypothetical protein
MHTVVAHEGAQVCKGIPEHMKSPKLGREPNCALGIHRGTRAR